MAELQPSDALFITSGPNKVPKELLMPPESDIEGLHRIGRGIMMCRESRMAPRGSIVLLRSAKREPIVIKGGIIDALRMFEHRKGYNDSIEPSVALSLKFVRSALEATWYAERTDRKTLSAYKAMVTSTERLLRDRSHEALVQAVEFLERGDDMFDVLGRFNPMSRAAIQVAVLRRLARFKQHIDQLEGYNAHVTNTLLAELKRSMWIIMLVEREIAEIARWWLIPNKLQSLKKDSAKQLAKRLRVCAGVLRQVIVRPFGQLCYRMAEDLLIMANQLEQFNLFHALDPLKRVVNAQVLPQVVIDMHSVTTLTSMAERWPQIELGSVEKRLITVKTRRIIQDLTDLDDADFRRPVGVEITHHLIEAVEALNIQDGPDLVAAKESMIQASHAVAPVAV